jgi:Tfp pilus assembly protein PilF
MNRRLRQLRDVVWSRAGAACAVFVSTAVLFGPSLRFGSVLLDDDLYVFANPLVLSGLTAEGLRAAFGAFHESLWAPVLWTSYMLDVEVFGTAPWGFHLTNVLLHAANAALAFLLLRRWTGRTWVVAAGALFWAWHPLRVESVAWIAERKDVLSGFFFLLCLGAYDRSVRGPDRARGWLWASAGGLALGLMAKPMLMTTPFLLLVLDVWPLGRWRADAPGRWKRLGVLAAEKWPFWLASAAAAALTLGGHAVQGGLHESGLGVRAARALIHPVYYLWRTVWPRHLAVLVPDVAATWPLVAGALLVLALLTAFLWHRRKAWPGGLVGWLWYLGTLLPVGGIVSFGVQSRADRFTYLPALGLSLWLASGWPLPGKRARLWGLACAVALAALAGATARQLPIWRDSGALFGRTLVLYPGQPVALLNAGVWHFGRGELAEAEQMYARLLRQDPDQRHALGNLAHIWVLQGRVAEARRLLEPERERADAHWLVPGTWGMARLHEGQPAAALPHLRESLARQPDDPGMNVELLRALYEAEDAPGAAAQAAHVAARFGPAYPALAALQSYYVQRWKQHGARAYAWRYFERLAEREPRNVAVLNNAAWLAATDPDTPPDIVAAAVRFAERAVELTQGQNSAVLDTLGAARAANGDFAGAAEAAEQALAAAPPGAPAEAIGVRLRLYRAGQPFRE